MAGGNTARETETGAYFALCESVITARSGMGGWGMNRQLQPPLVLSRALLSGASLPAWHVQIKANNCWGVFLMREKESGDFLVQPITN